jgi:SH3-like domain-containing protein
MRAWGLAIAAVALATGIASDALAQKTPPYWASIAAGKARMRTGPGENFPATWLYQRRDLPIRVVAVHSAWRKIEDPDGTQGWMLVNLLSDTRTAIVTGAIRPMRATPDAGARIVWRAEPGVVGRLSDCAGNWCEFTVGNKRGYIDISHVWGVDPGESLP